MEGKAFRGRLQAERQPAAAELRLVDDADLRATINELIADENLLALRIKTCEAFADALRCASTYFHVPACLAEDDAIRGLSSVIDMSAELASSTIDLFKSDRWYAGNSLIRQLIETEYLLTIFAADRAIASDWQHASPEQLRRWWNPAAMRAKTNGRFADEEYWGHCERGGHPSPDSSHLLRNTLRARLDRRFFWIDLVIHLKRAWFATKDCLIAFGYAERLSEDPYVRASDALAAWSERDPAPDLLKSVLPNK